jgi:hypothetical protein
MNEAEFTPILTDFFASKGITVTPIPRTDDKTPDFYLQSGEERALLELKLKGPDMDEVARDEAAMATGEIVHRNEPLSPWSTLSGVVRDGARQMQSFDPKNKMLHLVWLHAWGHEEDLLEELVTITLYGRTKLVGSFPGMQTCYYFKESAFFSQRSSLDGVISTRGNQLSFCLNTFSPRIAALRASPFFRAFEGGYTDPAAMEAKGDIWVADCDVPRSDVKGVLDYLRQKYSVEELQVMPMGQMTGRLDPMAWLRKQGYNPQFVGPTAEPPKEP